MSTQALPLILPADQRHLDALMTVMDAGFDPRFGEGWSRLQLAGALAMEGSFARLAMDEEGLACGFSLSRAVLDEAELLLVAVIGRVRGQGFGRALLDQALLDSRRKGCGLMFLEVRENNQLARSLYHAAGFFDVGRRMNYYIGSTGQRFTAITMRRSIQD